MLDSGLLPNNVDDRELIRDLVLSYRAAEKQLAEPQTVNGMADLDPGRDYRLNIRGVYEDLGEQVPRGYVEVIAGRREEGPRPAGSGRLELAEIIASPNNPLTARVFVNRVWHWVFGTGIVKTANDFGHLGDRPSHPELLDYLAGRFVEDGWSVKKLVRMLVMSETFQQSGRISAAAREADPRNRLLHHYPLRRLDARSHPRLTAGCFRDGWNGGSSAPPLTPTGQTKMRPSGFSQAHSTGRAAARSTSK